MVAFVCPGGPEAGAGREGEEGGGGLARTARTVVDRIRDSVESRAAQASSYSFLPADSCAEQSDSEEEEAPRRPQPRPARPARPARPGSIVADLARVQLWGAAAQYTMFDNQSTDSLDREEWRGGTGEGGLTKSDSAFTWQSYSSTTLSSQCRTEDEESSGYDSLDGLPGRPLSLHNPLYRGPALSPEPSHRDWAAALQPCSARQTSGANTAVELRDRPAAPQVRPRSEVLHTSFSRTGAGTRSTDGAADTAVGAGLMFVVGGREVGQVNMFQRNISMWKLQL